MGVRILYVSDVYYPRVNGVSTSIRTFRSELDALGYETVLVCPEYGSQMLLDGRGEEQVVRVPSRYIPLDPEDRAMHWRPLRRLDQTLTERFDLVHIHTPFFAHYAGLRFARRRGIPAIATYHTLFEEYLYHYVRLAPRGMMRSLSRRFSRGQCNALDAVVVPSEAMRSTLHRYGVTVPIQIIPTGLRLDEFAAGDGMRFRFRHQISRERPVLLFVGRVAFEKNISFLLRALARVKREHPEVLLVICGEGPARPSLQRLARQLDIVDNTRFVGYLERGTELLDCYRAANVFVFASRTETQGLVLLEAMACGVPVVSTAVMGTADVLREGRGARIAPEDEGAFAVLAARLLRDGAERELLSREGRSYATEWSAPTTARQLAQLYDTLGGRCGRAGEATGFGQSVLRRTGESS